LDFEIQEKSKKRKLSNANKKSRIRNEWTIQEDKIFLEGLKLYGADFTAIAKIIPSRTRYQVRTHYAYLSKSIQANDSIEDPSDGPHRRIKTRGRPPKGENSDYKPNELLIELTNCVRIIEQNRHQ
jgi:hypothetical protein